MSLGQGLEGWTLPSNLGQVFLISFEAFHRYNPFAVIEYWLSPETLKKGNMLIAQDRMVVLEIGAAVAMILLLARAAFRLKGHFHERHYRPAVDKSRGQQKLNDDRPLSWWAWPSYIFERPATLMTAVAGVTDCDSALEVLLSKFAFPP